MPKKPRKPKPYVFAKLFGPEGALNQVLVNASVYSVEEIVWVETDGLTN